MTTQRLTILLLAAASALAAPIAAQEEPPKKPDPEVKKQLEQFKEATTDKQRSRDEEAMNLVDKLTQRYESMHPKDQTAVQKAFYECLASSRVKRQPEHSRLFVAASAGLSTMGSDGAKLLVRAYNSNKFKKRDWVAMRAVMLRDIGKTKDPKQVNFLLERALRDHEDKIMQAAGQALGNYGDADQKIRKNVSKELIKMFNQVYNAAYANVDPNDPNVKRGREQLSAIQDPWNETLKRLTKQPINSPPDWMTFWNKNKGKNWDKLPG